MHGVGPPLESYYFGLGAPPFLIPEPIPADTSTPWSEAHVAALFSTLSEIRRFVVMLEHGPSLLTV